MIEFDNTKFTAKESMAFEEIMLYAQSYLNRNFCIEFEDCRKCPCRTLCHQLLGACTELYDDPQM